MFTVILRSGHRSRVYPRSALKVRKSATADLRGRVSKDERPRPGRRPPISGLPEIGTVARKSATADLRRLASRAPQGDGNESVLGAVGNAMPFNATSAPARSSIEGC